MNNNYANIINNAPYNTISLPDDYNINLSNPEINSQYGESINNPSQTSRPTSEQTNFYDPTKQIVDNYLKDNITMYDNRGKYFDTYLFNQKFDEYIEKKTAERKLKEQVQLYDLDTIENIQVLPYQLPLDKLLINLKNVWFELFDNLTNKKNINELFTINNFFYFGITFIIIFILYIMLSYIFE